MKVRTKSVEGGRAVVHMDFDFLCLRRSPCSITEHLWFGNTDHGAVLLHTRQVLRADHVLGVLGKRDAHSHRLRLLKRLCDVMHQGMRARLLTEPGYLLRLCIGV